MASWAMIWAVGPDDADFLGMAPSDLPARRGPSPTAEQVRAILAELGWPFTEGSDGSAVHLGAERVDGRWPPFTEITVHAEHLSVRHVGYAAYAVARGAARLCGPLGVLDEGGRGPLVVRPETTYAEFGRAFDYEADEAADSAWTPAE